MQSRNLFVLGLIALLGPSPVAAAVYVWIDGEGVTHISDDPAAVPDDTGAETAGP